MFVIKKGIENGERGTGRDLTAHKRKETLKITSLDLSEKIMMIIRITNNFVPAPRLIKYGGDNPCL